MRLFLSSAIAAVVLALVPGALAGGPSLGVLDPLAGIDYKAQDVSYVASVQDATTTLLATRTSTNAVLRQKTLRGAWGIPRVTLNGHAGGLSRNGHRLVLAEAAFPKTPLRAVSRFAVVDTGKLAIERTIRLRGDFAFDALSPNGRMLYLIEHVSQTDLNRYQVRAYDVAKGKLLARVVADARQKGWLMQGYPVAQLGSHTGRMVYTLYLNPENYPFVHALDTVGRKAVCIGLPWSWIGNQKAIETATMQFGAGGAKVRILGGSGDDARFVIDTKTLRLVKPSAQIATAQR
jgi:hypothetical protein